MISARTDLKRLPDSASLAESGVHDPLCECRCGGAQTTRFLQAIGREPEDLKAQLPLGSRFPLAITIASICDNIEDIINKGSMQPARRKICHVILFPHWDRCSAILSTKRHTTSR